MAWIPWCVSCHHNCIYDVPGLPRTRTSKCSDSVRGMPSPWIPACAGMTERCGGSSRDPLKTEQLPVRDVASRGGWYAVSPREEWRRQLRRVKVLFLPQQGGLSVGQESLVAAIGDRHDLSIFDHARPVAPQFEGVEVVVDMGGSVGTHEMMDAATETRVWQVMGTGLEHVDLEYMKSRGFTITHCPGTLSAVAMAEAAMAFMLMISRRRNEAMEVFARAGSNRPMGENLEGKVLGLVGFGASAQALAVRARAFDMRVFAVDVREIEPEVVERTGPEFLGTPEDLDYVIGESDFLSLHLHLNDSTKHTIDARRIGLMKPSASDHQRGAGSAGRRRRPCTPRSWRAASAARG